MAAHVGERFDFRRAAAEIMTNNPLGGICGLVCPERHCMKGCSRLDFDVPVNIPALQASIIARAKALGVMPALEKAGQNGKKIAIVGAGPAGIGAAALLVQRGYAVHLFEKEEKTGGACQWIPPHRLPRDVIESDIDFTLSLGNVTLKKGSTVDNAENLLKEGYDAVIVATGLPVPITLGLPHEELAVLGPNISKILPSIR